MKRARSAARDLPVYVCEYHDEALRCLHHAIRRRRLPFANLAMVHLDAHPDLGASAVMPADTVFESPHELYSSLRGDVGGIAQWILPAVYGGHLSAVWWVRPSWAVQIADGVYDVAVGKAPRAPEGEADRKGGASASVPREKGSAEGLSKLVSVGDEEALPETIQISCAEPYFVEDGTYCPEADLKEAKPLRLMVSELPTEGGLPSQIAIGSGNGESRAEIQAWTLDVCLDFFACGNPFLKQTRPSVAAPVAAVHNAATFRQSAVTDMQRFQADRDAFDVAYTTLLKGCIANDGKVNLKDLEALGACLPEGRRATLLRDLEGALAIARDSELEEILEALDMVTLPLHASDAEDVRQRLAAFDDFLGRLCAAPPAGGASGADSGAGAGASNGSAGSGEGRSVNRPAVVTIARSVVDGFCPMRWHCALETGVLDILRRHFGPSLDLLYSDELDALENAARPAARPAA